MKRRLAALFILKGSREVLSCQARSTAVKFLPFTRLATIFVSSGMVSVNWPSRSSLELTSILNPASLLAGKPLLYEAENDRSKTDKIEEDVLSIGCDIE